MALHTAAYDALFGDDEGRVCRDIPESACNAQPENVSAHLISLAATKAGDGLADPKLVLAWVLNAVGAPAFLIGLLVPLREAGALVPQLFAAGAIRSLPVRKWAWALASAVQGVCVAGMGVAVLTLSGAAAGWGVIVCLSVFALARSVASVAYKDVLGKTVSKAKRGTTTGTADTLSAAVVLAFGLALSFGVLERSVSVVAAALFVAAGCWMLAAVVFSTLAEEPGATGGGGNAFETAISQLSLLRTDKQLQRFIATRGLLIATGLAPPYLVTIAAQRGGTDLGQLGPFIVASGLASVLSSYFWGRMSDTSSRRVLMYSAMMGSGALVLAVGATFLVPASLLAYAMAAVLFVLMIAYKGVRLGRSTHIVDMGNEDTRASYTALSNTAVGILLLLAAGFGVVASLAGTWVVIAVFACMCAAAAIVAAGLNEVQQA
ncbi:MFS transporter permease [Pyruvatibacter sp.]|uniref:MFS transporter permease n=1 Tax=Pyruvatibacter sp. TaxID=1981328 RepID=UPI0032EAACE9